jgi:hypothetical protein
MSTTERALYRDLSRKMMASHGKLSSVVKSRFAASNSEALDTLEREKNLLGSVYVRPDQFDNCRSANDFFRRHNVTASKILKMDKCSGCQFYREASGACSLMGKDVVSEIDYSPAVFANEINALTVAGQLSKEAAARFLARSASEDLHDLLSEARGTVSPVETATYENHYEYAQLKTTHDIVSATVTEPATAIPLKHASVVRAAYQAAYKGATGDRLKNHLVNRYGSAAVVAAAEYIRPVVRMAGLLGNVILDMRGFKTADEAKTFMAKHRMKPAFLLKESCGCGGPGDQPDYSKVFPGLTLINYGHIGEVELEKVAGQLDSLVMNERITASKGRELKAKVGSVNGWDILQEAYLSPRPAPVAGPERKARAALPQVSREQVRKEFQSVEAREAARAKQALLDLIAKELEAGTIASDRAETARQNVLSGAHSRHDVLMDLVDAQQRLAAQKAAQADSDYRESVLGAEADHGFTLPTEAPVRSVAPPKVSSTERTAFRQKVVRALQGGMRGDELKDWVRKSFSMEVVRDQADFLRNALADADKLSLRTASEPVATNDPSIQYGLVGAMAGIGLNPITVSEDLEVGFDITLGDLS